MYCTSLLGGVRAQARGMWTLSNSSHGYVWLDSQKARHQGVCPIAGTLDHSECAEAAHGFASLPS